MAVYLALPAFQELIELVENDSANEDPVKALANAMLNYYFSPVNAWIITPKRTQNSAFADLFVLRVQRLNPSDRGFIDHTVAEAKKRGDDLGAAIHQLENALEQSNTKLGRCWAIIFHGLDLLFYEYHEYLPGNHRLLPTSPPSQPQRNKFHVRTDSLAINEMLMYMLHHETPNPR